ncbi:MAG TPA: hypothetical protein ENJ20_02125 [Bacteroidetes bacterium]|nr:hypothetical protein [Bacteroidota bacterium]
MHDIRCLQLRLNQYSFPYDMFRFRAAIIEKTRRQAPLFHNHNGDKNYVYRYPLIQYKVTYKKASIICLNEGVEEIHYLLQQPDMQLRVGQHINDYEIEEAQLYRFCVKISQHPFHYSLLNWLALNQRHYRRFRELENDETAQINLLQSILTGNILAFAKGVGWNVENRIHTQITEIKHLKTLPYKKQNVLAFTLNFQSNVSLPNFIGLGKGASTGFGIVKKIRTHANHSVN